MNSITIAILAAISIDFASPAAENEDILRAYTQLKEMLGEKFGSESNLIKAVKALENNPKLTVYGELEYETAKVEADQDPDLSKVAQDLLEAIKAKYGEEPILAVTRIDSAQNLIDDYWVSYGSQSPEEYGSQQILPGDSTTDAPPPK